METQLRQLCRQILEDCDVPLSASEVQVGIELTYKAYFEYSTVLWTLRMMEHGGECVTRLHHRSQSELPAFWLTSRGDPPDMKRITKKRGQQPKVQGAESLPSI